MISGQISNKIWDYGEVGMKKSKHTALLTGIRTQLSPGSLSHLKSFEESGSA
jgi:hypothetical protein